MSVICNESALIAQKRQVADRVRERLDAGWFDFGGNERLEMVFDLEMHLAFLGEAIRCNTPKLFMEYAVWTQDLLISSGGDRQRFGECLRAIDAQIRESGCGTWTAQATDCLAEALSQLDRVVSTSESHLTEVNPHRGLAEHFLHACLELKRHQAVALILDAVGNGVSVTEIYLEVITPVLYELGRLWHLNRISVGHEHYCTAIAQMVMAQLFPSIFEGNLKAGRLVSTCVAGELHEIGARMVSDLFELNGWDTVFLGADVPKDAVISTLIQHDAQVLAISVTLACNLGYVSELIEAVRTTPDCAGIRILVGGAAFNVDDNLWQRLGADGWAPEAQTAMALAARWRN
ncbi:MAG: hypothetical protein FIA97_12080 [Methylococcaceae bacterium]|nr:hypothetical protein [Methylococcaceae bacterium]